MLIIKCIKISYYSVGGIPTTEKRKTPSIRALEELHSLITTNCLKTHFKVSEHGSIGACYDTSPEKQKLDSKKSEIIKKISKEIEEYVIKKYQEYGIISVPVCRRSSSDGEDRLEIDLKVKKFPGAEKEIAAKEKAEAAYQKDLKAIDDWHFKALQSIALKQENLPEIPEFSRP